jgi:hypothetical protein
MGFYIQCQNNKNKADEIISTFDARRVSKEMAEAFAESEKAVICVVDNGLFEAAAYCYNMSEFKAFNRESDNRPKVWLIVDNKDSIEKASGKSK